MCTNMSNFGEIRSVRDRYIYYYLRGTDRHHREQVTYSDSTETKSGMWNIDSEMTRRSEMANM